MSMSKKEFEIGEVFQLGLMKIRVEKRDEDKRCHECFFERLCWADEKLCDDIVGECDSYYRKDGTDVIFKVKE